MNPCSKQIILQCFLRSSKIENAGYTHAISWLKSAKSTTLSYILTFSEASASTTTGIAGHVRRTERARSGKQCHALEQSCFVAWLIPLVGACCSSSSPRRLEDADDPFARHAKNQVSERRAESGNTWLVVVAHYTCAGSRPPGSFASLLPSLVGINTTSSSRIPGKMSTRRGTGWFAAATQTLTSSRTFIRFSTKSCTAISNG